MLPFIMYLSGFDLLRLSNFSKSPLKNSLDSLSVGTSWKNYINWYNLCVIKHTVIFKEQLYGCFCKLKSVIKLSKILATMKYYKKTFLIKQLLRSFKYFLFILIFSETNSRFRTQTLKSSSTFFFFFYSRKTFNSVNSTNYEAFVSFSNWIILSFL